MTRRAGVPLATAEDVRFSTDDGVRIAASYLPAGGTAHSPAESTEASAPHVAAGTPTKPPEPGHGHTLPALVVAHGFTGSSRTPAVRRITERLHRQGFPVLAIDFRGHGRSGGLGTAGDLEVHDVAAAVAYLRERGHSLVAVLGWSMGGSAVLRYAGLGGDADAVVAVSSPATWYERGTRSMRVVHWLCETPSGRLTCRIARRTRLAAGAWTVVPAAPVEVVGSIAPVPLLLVHGSDDHYFPLRHARELAAAAPAADAWIETGMGHAETGTSPELVDRIGAWLATAVSAPAVCDDGFRD
jgi:pimeloyl-ACP methyl ester carboxylesterase